MIAILCRPVGWIFIIKKIKFKGMGVEFIRWMARELIKMCRDHLTIGGNGNLKNKKSTNDLIMQFVAFSFFSEARWARNDPTTTAMLMYLNRWRQLSLFFLWIINRRPVFFFLGITQWGHIVPCSMYYCTRGKDFIN